MVQFSGVNWLIFGLVLAGLNLFGWLFAALVRNMAKRRVEGQTAWLVVVGVAVTGGASALLIGIENALLLASCFVASGIPMVVEYVSRVEAERQADHELAKRQSKDI